ncbi:MAG: DUF4369 domain-containing protein [Prevotellaceae bacterium]|jgi:peroxiredoxin|nr:DUF4369 domain-containing protein [Prevotellaceae bacterium]
MKKLLFGVVLTALLAGCQSQPKFEVTGSVTGAEGKKLYFELSGVDEVVTLDSVKLKSNGHYTFRYARPEAPEFYRLRIENQVINLAIDSTETVMINAPYKDFSTAYQVHGSLNSEKIRELTLKQIKLQNDINELGKRARATRMRNKAYEDSVTVLLNNYKDDVTKNYIYNAPNSTAAYYALFQTINNLRIFDPENSRTDIKSFAAVATSMDTHYPHSSRSKNLYNIVIRGYRNTRTTTKEQTIDLPADKVNEAGVIDIALKDIKGQSHKLTSLKGKVVLLDFTIYQNAIAADHNLWLRELYDKYASKGLEIYQVSFDADEHFWRRSADNLPWICVRDPQGIYSVTLSLYSVQNLPTYFLVDRNNDLVMRGEDVKDVETAVRTLL